MWVSENEGHHNYILEACLNYYGNKTVYKIQVGLMESHRMIVVPICAHPYSSSTRDVCPKVYKAEK